MSIDEEFKNSEISNFITKISNIIVEFDKFDSLPRKITLNNKEITVLQGEINKINNTSSKDPFQFLKDTNNLNIKKKKEIIIRNEINDMKDELTNLSASIRDKLTTTTENEKSRIEADNVIANAKSEEKKKKCNIITFFSKCISGIKTF